MCKKLNNLHLWRGDKPRRWGISHYRDCFSLLMSQGCIYHANLVNGRREWAISKLFSREDSWGVICIWWLIPIIFIDGLNPEFLLMWLLYLCDDALRLPFGFLCVNQVPRVALTSLNISSTSYPICRICLHHLVSREVNAPLRARVVERVRRERS